MIFQPIAFTWPASLSDIAQEMAGFLTNASAELDSAGERLTAAPGASLVNNPVAGECVGAAASFNQLVDLVAGRVRVLCVHPWQQGVGQGENHYRYLSPANAMVHAAAKVTEAVDAHRPRGALDALTIIITGKSFADFSNSLRAFNQLFPVPDLQLCERRAGQLAILENDKQILPDAMRNAYWRDRNKITAGLLRNGLSVVGEVCAHAMAYEGGGTDPDAELQILIQKKHATLQASSDAIEALAGQFSGGNAKAVFLENQTPQQLQNTLSNSGLTHDDPLCCCLVLTAEQGGLLTLQQLLGL